MVRHLRSYCSITLGLGLKKGNFITELSYIISVGLDTVGYIISVGLDTVGVLTLSMLFTLLVVLEVSSLIDLIAIHMAGVIPCGGSAAAQNCSIGSLISVANAMAD